MTLTLDYFERAVKTARDGYAELTEPHRIIIRDGAIQRFEYTMNWPGKCCNAFYPLGAAAIVWCGWPARICFASPPTSDLLMTQRRGLSITTAATTAPMNMWKNKRQPLPNCCRIFCAMLPS